MSRLYSKAGGLKPGRSVFNLSYEKKMDMDAGQLVPIFCEEMVPGDKFVMFNEMVIRMQPMLAPIMHVIRAFVHCFFVPYRLLWEHWEEFITGGIDGEGPKDGEVSIPLPRWQPTNNAKYSLWDYLGFPPGVDPKGAYPLDFPRRAYNLVWNEYYRDQNLQDEVSLDNENILLRNRGKDYFTTSLPDMQRGIAPSFPVSGILEAEGIDRDITLSNTSDSTARKLLTISEATHGYRVGLETSPLANGAARWKDPAIKIDLSNAVTFDVADMRLAFQIQKWMERNMRAGVRYTEFLRAHYGVSPRDDRLQRPEYIGGTKTDITVSEVLQTSQTSETSPQGNLAGHGLNASTSKIGSYYATEFGLVIGIMSIMPKNAYQQGIDRQWLRRSRYDFYTPEFANLSEQAVETAEIYASDVEADNVDIFGYQGRYNEMRSKHDMVCGAMRDTFDYWHLGLQFESKPVLNEDFIQAKPDLYKRIFAVQSEPGYIVNVGNIIKAIRPLPTMPVPGYIDHN